MRHWLGGNFGRGNVWVKRDWMPVFKPSEKDLWDWYLMVSQKLSCLSEADRRMIIACYKKSWRACQTAFAILTRNKSRLRRLARHLTADAIQKQEIPMTPLPDKTETSPSDAIQFRAALLENLLKQKSAGDPDVPRLKQCLEYLRRGQFPPDEVVFPVSQNEPLQ
jgi:hypothetical protein